MTCKQLEREEVPPPPRRAFEGVVDDGDRRWRFKQGLLVRYVRYIPEAKQRAGQLPWSEHWGAEDARR
jgi:hypothetical protein